MLLEKRKNKRFEDFPSATLYLDDLSEMLATLAEVCDRVELKTGDYTISEPVELEILASKFPNGRFGHVYLQGYDPYVSVDIRMSGVSAYISDETLELCGLVSKIRDIVQRRKKRNLHPGWLFSALSFSAASVGTLQIMSKEYLTGSLLIMLSLASIPSIVSYEMKNTVIVHTQPRASVKSFFERKKDDIVLVVIATLFGGFVTYLITKLLP